MAVDWIWIVLLGALLGAAGQGVRIIVGLKKASDEAATQGHRLAEHFEPARLLVSLLIGAVAGILAAILILQPATPINRQALLGLAAAGYSGADFVEGFISRYLPSGRDQPLAIAAAGVLAPSQPHAPALAAAAVVADPASTVPAPTVNP